MRHLTSKGRVWLRQASGKSRWQASQSRHSIYCMIPTLIAHGAAVDAVNQRGETALLLACTHMCEVSVQALLAAGASVNFQPPGGGVNTPLISVVSNGSSTLLTVLLGANADPNLTNFSRDTALMNACHKFNITENRNLGRNCIILPLMMKLPPKIALLMTQSLGVQGSHSTPARRRRKDTPPPPMSTECVVFIARSVADGCRFARLQALLASAGSKREPWLLYNVEPDESSLTQLRLASPRLRLARQANVTSFAWKVFGGKLINYSKAAFLLWLLSEGKHCSHVWQIEDDVFYTGRWDRLFDAHDSQRDDLLALTSPLAPTSNWSFASHCVLGPQLSCREAHGNGQQVRVEWPVLRISQRLAVEVARVQKEGGHGFHEAILEPVCARAKWACSSAPLLPAHIGRLVGGHIGVLPKMAQTLETLALHWPRSRPSTSSSPGAQTGSIPAGKVFHPVKCEADAELGAKAQRWVARHDVLGADRV